MLVDSHCHLDFPDFNGREAELVAAMAANDVGHALIAGVTLERFPSVRALVERFSNLYAAVGVHPDTQEGKEPDEATLIRLAAHPKVVAIGETGLDYYRLEGDLEWQRDRFRTHIRAARRCGKPLIIHTREAAADTLRILEEEDGGKAGGVFHCFTETAAVAQAALALGFHISISGIVTFKNALQVKEVARSVPLDRLLVETDAPYLAPVPHRGKLNHPALVRHVAEEIARLRGIGLDELTQATTTNFQRLFAPEKDA
ncbi:TatD family hydrolase [Sulfuritalea sp.]|uniref:TatD family hydrolase n=1 Tax=Sulfuritalea sp. TaxID=2480090 RepID=UPI001AC49727|nr:TatD family hydrolase [Sulfuritalea sp.]MBN8476153.1 TatD family hydrolase [Sulfuritalea sp.]